MASSKHIGEAAFIGQRGINLIEKILLDMGFTWHPTNQGMEAGLDGFLEIRNKESGEVFNSVIFVQSKATDNPFTAETQDSFEYLCEQRDLDYWLKGNAPILLIRSRPRTNEAYWVSLKDYFKDLQRRATRKIIFNKRIDRFDINAAARLRALAIPPGSGLYFPPLPKREKLYSNLLQVQKYPSKIWCAHTHYRFDSQIRHRFREQGIRMGHEWLLKNKSIYSFYDLSHEAWQEICDQGTVECFSSSEWFCSDDISKHNDFVRLLNLSLERKLHHLDIQFHSKHEFFYFRLPSDMRFWREPYQSIAKRTSRVVVEHYPNKKNPEMSGYFRHLAFSARFLEIERKWLLQLTPTYYYTHDGYRPVRRYEELLKGIKRLEHNSAVLGQVVFLADYLSRPAGLFTRTSELEFGRLETFLLDVGINDQDWLPHEEDQGTAIRNAADDELGLFA